jgi:hypothetical protein
MSNNTDNNDESINSAPMRRTSHGSIAEPHRSLRFKNPFASAMHFAERTEFYGGGQWQEVTSPDGVRCYVTRLWGKEPVAA